MAMAEARADGYDPRDRRAVRRDGVGRGMTWGGVGGK